MSGTTAGSLKVIELAALDDHHVEPIDGNTASDKWFFNNLLTLPSSGRLARGFAPVKPPLMSNVRPRVEASPTWRGSLPLLLATNSVNRVPNAKIPRPR